MKKYSLLLLVIFVGLLAACAPSPEQVAEGKQITIMAQITATAAAQEADSRTLDLRRKAVEVQAYGEALKQAQVTVNERLDQAISTITVVGIIVACALLIAAAFVVTTTIRNLSNAAVKGANLAACQVHLDPETRTFPLLTGAGGMVANMNNGQVLCLNTPQAPLPMLMQSDAQVRTTGVIVGTIAKAAGNPLMHGENWRALDNLAAGAAMVPLLGLQAKELEDDVNALPHPNGRILRNGGRNIGSKESLL
jgi:hypothetical protein